MIILPINSVINPLLYDDFITRVIKAPLLYIRSDLANSATYQSFIARFRTRNLETIEMEQMQVREDVSRIVAVGNSVCAK
jgi:hypothetical protein